MNILANIISLTIVFAVPLMLVALGGMYSEHSGVINLALEGIMVIGALCACFSLQSFDRSGFGPAHPQLSMLAAILIAGVSGMIFSLLLAFAAISTGTGPDHHPDPQLDPDHPGHLWYGSGQRLPGFPDFQIFLSDNPHRRPALLCGMDPHVPDPFRPAPAGLR